MVNRIAVLLAAVGLVGVAYGAEQACGTLLAPACPDGSFCSTAEGQCSNALGGLNTKGGVCKVKPDMCTQNVEPVCGCDGVDYSNECVARLKGVSVAANGECTKGGVLGNLLPGNTGGGSSSPVAAAEVKGTSTTDCGGATAIKCAPEYVCIYEPGNECGAAKGLGKCELAGDMLCTAEFLPVCGCDNKTYSNDCVARYQNGVDVKHKGECKEGAEATTAGTPIAVDKEGGEGTTAGTPVAVDKDGEVAKDGINSNTELIGGRTWSPETTSGGVSRFGGHLGGLMAVMTVGGMVLGALVML